ncbi:TRAP transporter large permease subunit [Amorphus sp. MBR-141]
MSSPPEAPSGAASPAPAPPPETAAGRLLALGNRLVGVAATTFATVSALWIFAMMILVCADVASRGIANRPIMGVAEIVSYSVPSCVFLAIALSIRTGRFLRADFIFEKVEQRYPRAGALFDTLFSFAGTWVFFKVAEGLWPRVVRSWVNDDFFGSVGTFTAPTWPFFGTIFLGACLATLQFAVLTLAAAGSAVGKRSAPEPVAGTLLVLGFLAIVGGGAALAITGDLSPIDLGFVALAGMLFLVLAGLHIASALILLSFLGIWLVRDNLLVADRSLALASMGSINSYGFGVIPLFILMGLFVDIANVGRDAFAVAAGLLRRIRGGLGVATVFANAIFAAITGSSIASAAVFTRVATPQMIAHGYTRRFSVGVVAGSSVLGMLIPPSLLLIVYGLIAEVSVGKLFTAAILPGLLLAATFCATILAMAWLMPGQVGRTRPADDLEGVSLRDFTLKLLPILSLIVVVVGGIYAGYFTPTESGAVGAAGGFLIALARRELTWGRLRQVLLEAAEISAAILFLIIAANLYSRMLTLTTIPQSVAGWIVAADLSLTAFLAIYLVILIVLGMFLDSVSIMLVVLPLMLPVVVALDGDLVWFGVVTTIAVEIGLLTPPFGLAAYVVRGTLPPGTASLAEIFAGCVPFVVAMILVTIVLMAFPAISLALL